MSRKFSISRKMSNFGLNFSDNQPTDASSPSLPWPIIRDEYKIKKSIGQGATSNVYEAECITSGQIRKCAMKIINLEKCTNSSLLEEIKREIKSMKNMKNENIVTYYASFVKNTDLFIIMDLCTRGSLLDIIKRTQTKGDITCGVFDESTIATILKDVLKGLIYIHDNGLVHRDLKCGNLLVKEDGVIQIADFGVAAFLAAQPMQATGSSLDNKRFTFVGTPCWMAPEVMQQVKGYNQKADIWSLGITAIELAAGQAPYAKYTPMKVLMLTLQNESPDIDTAATSSNQYANYGQKYRRFSKLCLNKDPELRPPAKELLQLPFIKSKAKDREWLCKVLLNDDVVSFEPRTSDEDEELGGEKVAYSNYSGEWNFDLQPLGDHLHNCEDKDHHHTPESSGLHDSKPQTSHICVSYRITLRKRNPKKNNDLEDISFDYVHGKDSFELLARELVDADLLHGCDLLLVAHNMQELVANPQNAERVFALNSVPANGVVHEHDLHGYAKVLLRCNTNNAGSVSTGSSNNSSNNHTPTHNASPSHASSQNTLTANPNNNSGTARGGTALNNQPTTPPSQMALS